MAIKLRPKLNRTMFRLYLFYNAESTCEKYKWNESFQLKIRSNLTLFQIFYFKIYFAVSQFCNFVLTTTFVFVVNPTEHLMAVKS